MGTHELPSAEIIVRDVEKAYRSGELASFDSRFIPSLDDFDPEIREAIPELTKACGEFFLDQVFNNYPSNHTDPANRMVDSFKGWRKNVLLSPKCRQSLKQAVDNLTLKKLSDIAAMEMTHFSACPFNEENIGLAEEWEKVSKVAKNAAAIWYTTT